MDAAVWRSPCRSCTNSLPQIGSRPLSPVFWSRRHENPVGLAVQRSVCESRRCPDVHRWEPGLDAVPSCLWSRGRLTSTSSWISTVPLSRQYFDVVKTQRPAWFQCFWFVFENCNCLHLESPFSCRAVVLSFGLTWFSLLFHVTQSCCKNRPCELDAISCFSVQ